MPVEDVHGPRVEIGGEEEVAGGITAQGQAFIDSSR